MDPVRGTGRLLLLLVRLDEVEGVQGWCKGVDEEECGRIEEGRGEGEVAEREWIRRR